MGRDTLRAGPGQQEKGRGLAWLDFRESENETHCCPGKKNPTSPQAVEKVKNL